MDSGGGAVSFYLLAQKGYSVYPQTLLASQKYSPGQMIHFIYDVIEDRVFSRVMFTRNNPLFAYHWLFANRCDSKSHDALLSPDALSATV